jgi:hypothetical protein
MKTASWIIRERATRRVICETFNAKAIAQLNIKRYEAVPILEYLTELNRAIKAGEGACVLSIMCSY